MKLTAILVFLSVRVFAQEGPISADSINLAFNNNFQGFGLITAEPYQVFVVAEDEHNRREVPAATLKLLQFLHQKKNIRTLCIEGGQSTAFLVNRFLEQQDTTLLREIVRHTFFWSREHHEFLMKLAEWNRKLEPSNKVTIKSADIELKQESVILATNLLLENKSIPHELRLLEEFKRIYSLKAAHRQNYQALNVYYYYDKDICKKLAEDLWSDLSAKETPYRSFFGDDYLLFKAMLNDLRTLYQFNYRKETRFKFRDNIIYSKLLEVHQSSPEGFIYVVGAKHARPGSSSFRLKHEPSSPFRNRVAIINTTGKSGPDSFRGAKVISEYYRQLPADFRNSKNLIFRNASAANSAAVLFDFTLAFRDDEHVRPFPRTYRGR